MARDSNFLASIQAAHNPSARPITKSHLPKGAVGALAAGLASLQEAGIQEIDTSLVDDGGPQDRIIEDYVVDDADLRENIEKHGQLVPVLLRPHPAVAGRYQIIYGRRRLKACRGLGIKVRANIRQLSDQESVVAQGQENNARRDLSYNERVGFSEAILAAGYDSLTVQAALNVARNRVSEYGKISRAIPVAVRNAIGAAPNVGRDRWDEMARSFAAGKLTELGALQVVTGLHGATSDARFNALLASANKRGARPEGNARSAVLEPVRGVRILASSARVDVSVAKKDNAFGLWFEKNAEAIMNELHARFTEEAGGAD